MTNEMKLLRAFIEASGYEVEEIPVMEGENQRIQILKGGDLSIEFDYKLTKKSKPAMNKINEDREIELITGRKL